MWEHYQKVVSAYKRKDARAFAALFSPDFKAKMWDGKTVDRQALEEWARQDMAETKALYSARVIIDKAAIRGQEETHEGTEVWNYKFADLRGQYGICPLCSRTFCCARARVTQRIPATRKPAPGTKRARCGVWTCARSCAVFARRSRSVRSARRVNAQECQEYEDCRAAGPAGSTRGTRWAAWEEKRAI